MWEVRHGFPAAAAACRAGTGATRSTTWPGCGRWSERGKRGLSLQAAIELAPSAADEQPPSVYASLRARVPALEPQLLPKRGDAGDVARDRGRVPGAGRATAPVRLLSARTLLPRSRSSRWRELARTAERAVVLADFRRVRRPQTGADRDPDRGVRSGRPRVGDRVRVAELRRVPGRLGAAASDAAAASACSRRSGRSRRPPSAWPPRCAAARLARRRRICSPTCASGSTRRPVAREHELRSAIQLSTRMVRLRRRLIAGDARRRASAASQ